MALTDDHAEEAQRLLRSARPGSVCHVPGDQVAAMRAAHLAEVDALRRRIDELEHALAQLDAESAERTAGDVGNDDVPTGVTTIRLAPKHQRRRTDPPEAEAPASPHPPVEQGIADETVLDEMVSTVTSGAAAWDDDEVSFAERVAARAFFREDVTDTRARRWLLREG